MGRLGRGRMWSDWTDDGDIDRGVWKVIYKEVGERVQSGGVRDD